MQPKLLIADDDPGIVSLLKDYFTVNDYLVYTAANGTEALQKISCAPDLILLDINMPGQNGLAVCEQIRAHVACPILFLTARMEDADKIKGFAAGGDDYITKPFSIDELGARVAAHLRRETRRSGTAQIRVAGDLLIDYAAHTVYAGDTEIVLPKKEFDILALLSQNPGQVFSKERIYELVWSYDADGDSAVVAEHIKRLRAKCKDAGAQEHVETVWGVGYKWK